jgi:hypothetical protein
VNISQTSALKNEHIFLELFAVNAFVVKIVLEMSERRRKNKYIKTIKMEKRLTAIF